MAVVESLWLGGWLAKLLWVGDSNSLEFGGFGVLKKVGSISDKVWVCGRLRLVQGYV